VAKSFGTLVAEFVKDHPECRSPFFSRLKVNFLMLERMLSAGELSPMSLGELFFDMCDRDVVIMVKIKGMHFYRDQLFLPVFRGSIHAE
jgi:hypothetical protein